MFRKSLLTTAVLACIAGCMEKSGTSTAKADEAMKPMAMAMPDPQMKLVLDTLASLGGKPIEALSPDEARKQPTPADAVGKIMAMKGIKPGASMMLDKLSTVMVPGKDGNQIPVRVYTPAGATGLMPTVVYVHGGGWVIGSDDVYDASIRAVANGAKAVVLAVDYRLAPEHKFPASHEDVYSVLQWASMHASEVGGDNKKIAILGESAGGNMATSACLMAKDRRGFMPIAQVLVYPVTNNDMNTPSYKANAMAKPLNKAMMAWFFEKEMSSPADAMNKYLLPLKATEAELKGLPPATVITDEIDPLRSEGMAYADKLKAAGVEVKSKDFTGVSHEFFGMGAVVDKAKEAEMFASERLKDAFAR